MTKVRWPKISIQNLHPKKRVDLKPIRAALESLKPKTREGAGIFFMDDRQISNLAGKFRGSPRPTDVLAFGDDIREIVISIDTAGRQARERGHKLSVELTLLCVHGLLHLKGYGDETRKDFCRMRVMEFETMMRIMP